MSSVSVTVLKSSKDTFILRLLVRALSVVFVTATHWLNCYINNTLWHLFADNLFFAKRSRDCSEIYQSGERSDGVYTVYLGQAQSPVQVYCDMTTDGGAWTVCIMDTQVVNSKVTIV